MEAITERTEKMDAYKDQQPLVELKNVKKYFELSLGLLKTILRYEKDIGCGQFLPVV